MILLLGSRGHLHTINTKDARSDGFCNMVSIPGIKVDFRVRILAQARIECTSTTYGMDFIIHTLPRPLDGSQPLEKHSRWWNLLTMAKQMLLGTTCSDPRMTGDNTRCTLLLSHNTHGVRTSKICPRKKSKPVCCVSNTHAP